MSGNKIRPIAFYLPQFYPTPENDVWWEPGFTEWTNVVRARPLFKGHYQPRIPRDLGFYDLRVPETREKQAELAREAGLEGFCYWHYWFGNGKKILDRVFSDVVSSGRPDFPFCLCWANHSWYAKTWAPNAVDKLLIEQTYPGVDDYSSHFYELLPAFKDKRYQRQDGKLIFGIFDPTFADCQKFMDVWNALARQHGLGGFYFFGLLQEQHIAQRITAKLDAIVYDSLQDSYHSYRSSWMLTRIKNFLVNYLGIPYAKAYDKYVNEANIYFQQHSSWIPCIDPDFDHSPRSDEKWVIMKNSTPEAFGRLCKETRELVSGKAGTNNLLFIKAWNEWGEGNYLEPDMRWGKQYIIEAAKAFK